MTTQPHTISPGTDQPSLPNQPFFSWLRGETTLFISQIAAALGLVYFLAALVYYVTGAKAHGEFLFDAANIKVFVDYAHIVFMALFILVLIRYLDDNSAGSYRVGLVYKRVFADNLNKAEADRPSENLRNEDAAIDEKSSTSSPEESTERLRKFKRRFLWFWCAMLVLYVVFGWRHTYDRINPAGKGPESAAPASSQPTDKSESLEVTVAPPNVSVLIKSEVSERFESPRNDDSDPVKRRDVVFSILEFVCNNGSLLIVYWCFLSLYLPPDAARSMERRHIWLSLSLLSIFTVLFPSLVITKGTLTAGDLRGYSAVFYALSGTINAVVLALLIARLDSKLIGLSSRLICVLYCYAAVQPLFVAFEQGPSNVMAQITASVLVFVLVSKIYFFLIIMYALQTGRMLNYLVCFPKLREQTNAAPPRHTRTRFKREESTNRIMGKIDRLEKYLYFRQKRRVRVRFNRRMKHLSSWMRSQAPLTISKWLGLSSISIFFICLIGYVVIRRLGAATAIGSNHAIALHRFNVGVDITQLVVVGGMIVALFLVRKDNSCHADTVMETGKDIFNAELEDSRYPPKKAEKQLEKFKEYFLWFWIVTLLLYVVLLVEELHGKPTLFSGSIVGIKTAALILAYPFLKFLFGTLNLLFVFWCFVVLQSPPYDDRSKMRQKLLVNYSSFVIGLLIAAFVLLASFAVGNGSDQNRLIGYATVFDGVTGTLSGVALALLIARLDSKLFIARLPNKVFNLQSPLIYILFAYAAIQPLFVVFELENVFKAIEAVVLLAALGLKVCFFLVIANTLQSGKMLNYLVCFPFLRDRVDSIFENQFEIRTSAAGAGRSFTFSIWKKNSLVYSSVEHFPNRKKCDMAINELHKLVPDIKLKDQPADVAGTYWVEIRYSDGEPFCESVPLRSEKEREDLIEETKQYIPYCKYNRA